MLALALLFFVLIILLAIVVRQLQRFFHLYAETEFDKSPAHTSAEERTAQDIFLNQQYEINEGLKRNLLQIRDQLQEAEPLLPTHSEQSIAITRLFEKALVRNIDFLIKLEDKAK